MISDIWFLFAFCRFCNVCFCRRRFWCRLYLWVSC